MSIPMLDENADLVSAGASLHWLVPFRKNPIEDKWAAASIQSLGDLQRKYRRDANIGIRLGEPSSTGAGFIHLIDLDIRKAECADEAWRALLTLWPGAKGFPSVISGSGGASRHLYFVTSTPFRKKKLAQSAGFTMVWDEEKGREVKKNDWEIDLMGTGSQAVIPPSIHPDTKKPYVWERRFDLDMLELSFLSPDTVRGWGVETSAPAAGGDDDDDGLMSAVRSAPIDMEPSEVDAILRDLPPDWLDSRDQWWLVGMALHHQFEGKNAGYERWVEWSRQSPKFDAKDQARVWKSFKGTDNPVRMATLIAAANEARIMDDLDQAGPSTDLSDLFGAADLSAPVRMHPAEGWQKLLKLTEEGAVVSNAHNIGLIVENDIRFCGVVGWNLLADTFKRINEPLVHPGKARMKKAPRQLNGWAWRISDPENGDDFIELNRDHLRQIIEAPTTQGGYDIKVSERDLSAALSVSASQQVYHPIRNFVLGNKWDGVPRIETLFIDFLKCDDTPYHRDVSRLFFLGAIARIFEPGCKWDYVPILEGAQGARKSTFAQTLAHNPKWAGELSSEFSNHSKIFESHDRKWIVEIPELQGFSKADTRELKATITRQVDNIRRPYEKMAKEVPRQCVFIGTINEATYLRDSTGGRRFWPVECKTDSIDINRLRTIVGQLWAEAFSVYQAMRAEQPYGDLPLYIRDPEAAAEAKAHQESRREESQEEVMAGQIQSWLDRPVTDLFEEGQGDVYRIETCTQQIWEDCLGRTGIVGRFEATTIGRAMNLVVGWTRSKGAIRTGDLVKKYGMCRIYTRD